jgi:hypothetical protein
MKRANLGLKEMGFANGVEGFAIYAVHKLLKKVINTSSGIRDSVEVKLNDYLAFSCIDSDDDDDDDDDETMFGVILHDEKYRELLPT